MSDRYAPWKPTSSIIPLTSPPLLHESLLANLRRVSATVAARRIDHSPQRTNMAGETILIIEDNEVNRVLVRDMLRFKGYQTLEARSAEEGIRVAREKKPALILMDFHLPGMNGIEAFQALRADVDTRAIPVIAVTASAMPEDRKQILAAGFDGMQTKPIHVVEFLGLIEQVLRSVGRAQ